MIRRSSVFPPTDPKTRLVPPKLPQPLVQLVDAAPIPAGLVAGVCTAVREFTALNLKATELVWETGPT